MQFTVEELNQVLKDHLLWLQYINKGKRADLRGADLREADLRGANLREANLREASLQGASLRGANLREADLREANLREADLRGASLRRADLREASLRRADLREANLRGANLWGANLPDFLICPEEGEFIAFKNVRHDIILKLKIPADAKRTSSLISRKCRASKAILIAAYNFDGSESRLTEFKSTCDPNFIYRIGETVEVDDYDPDIRVECTKGIHFFMTRKEAIEYF